MLLGLSLVVPVLTLGSPIVLVPGISGTGLLSRFTAKSEFYRCVGQWEAERDADLSEGYRHDVWYRTWLTLDTFRPPASHQECWYRIMTLRYQKSALSLNSLGEWLDPEGVETVVDEGIHGIDYLDYFAGYGLPMTRYYHDMIVALTNAFKEPINSNDTKIGSSDDASKEGDAGSLLTRLNRFISLRARPFIKGYQHLRRSHQLGAAAPYVRDENLVAFGYDWRLPVWQLDWEAFKLKIEKLYRDNDHQRVIVISHSMGSLWLNYFLHTRVDQAWKDKFLNAIISVNGANGGSFKAIRAILSGYSPVSFSAWYIKFPQLISMLRVRELCRTFPSLFTLVPHELIYGEDFPVASVQGGYHFTLQNWTHAIEDEEVRDRIDLTRAAVGDVALKDPGVRYFCFYTIQNEQATEYQYDYDKGDFDHNPQLTYTWGDGTVPAYSLGYCRSWTNTRMVKVFKGIDHMFALRDPTLVQAVIDVVKHLRSTPGE